MRATVNATALLTVLLTAFKAIPSKSAIQIHSSFHISVDRDLITVTATDGQMEYRTALLAADAPESGDFTVDAKRLTDIIKSVKGLPVTMTADGSTLHIDCLAAEFDIPIGDANEFPRRPEPAEWEHTFTLPSSAVAKAMDYAAYAVSAEAIRPVMTGMFWDIKPDSVTWVASDTHKLAAHTFKTETASEIAVIVPSATSDLIRKMCSESENLEIAASDKEIRFTSGLTSLSSTLVKGRYPDYNRVIPQAFERGGTTVESSALQLALSRATLCAGSASKLVKMTLSAQGGRLDSTDRDYQTKAGAKFDAEWNGDNFTVGLSADYLMEIIKAHKGNLQMQFKSPSHPVIFSPATQNDGENSRTILMPLAILD